MVSSWYLDDLSDKSRDVSTTKLPVLCLTDSVNSICILDYQTYGDLRADWVVPKMSTPQLFSNAASHPKTIIKVEAIEVKDISIVYG